MSYSPNEMLGVASMVCGLGSGTLQKTYANMGEALNDFWERRIIPTKNRHSAELGAQLLPLFGVDARDYRIAWDYSKSGGAAGERGCEACTGAGGLPGGAD